MNPIFKASLNDWLNPRKRSLLFLGGVLLMTLAVVCLISSTIVFTRETFLISLAWLFGFGFLFFNVAYLFFLSVCHPLIKAPVLKEAYIKGFPKIINISF